MARRAAVLSRVIIDVQPTAAIAARTWGDIWGATVAKPSVPRHIRPAPSSRNKLER
jgi:hypothetical protein